MRQWASRWCWAACGEMIARAVTGADIDQHAIWRERFVECPVAHPSLMIRRERLAALRYRDRGWPEDVDISVTDDDLDAMFGDCGLRHRRDERALTMQELDGELQAGRPVMVALLRPHGAAHLFVVAGAADQNRYRILDPKRGELEESYETLVASSFGTWHASWWRFEAASR